MKKSDLKTNWKTMIEKISKKTSIKKVIALNASLNATWICGTIDLI